MRAEDDAALEAEHEVLADRLDRLEPPAVELLGDARGLRARVRRLDLEPLADERPQRAARHGGGVSPSGTPRAYDPHYSSASDPTLYSGAAPPYVCRRRRLLARLGRGRARSSSASTAPAGCSTSAAAPAC